MSRPPLYDDGMVREWPQGRIHPKHYARIIRLSEALGKTFNATLYTLLNTILDEVDVLEESALQPEERVIYDD